MPEIFDWLIWRKRSVSGIQDLSRGEDSILEISFSEIGEKKIEGEHAAITISFRKLNDIRVRLTC